MTDIRQLVTEAQPLHDRGDYRGAIDALYQVLRREPAYFEADATAFVASVADSDRSEFWIRPPGLYPDEADLKSVFEFIYERAVWGGGSGGGSDLQNTVLYVACLQAIMDRLDVRTIVDLGCGDWRFSRYLNFDGRNYLGLDIVPTVIAANAERYGAANIRFGQADVTTMSAMPECDLIVCKDVLQHLSNRNVAAVLANCRATRLVLITNDYHPANVENADGGTRPLDISRPPFNYPARPVCRTGVKVSFFNG